MKRIIALIMCICVCFSVIFMSSCRKYDYNGENDDLFTIAVNSLLWNFGESLQADFYKDSSIVILEEDNFGRKLFLYEEENNILLDLNTIYALIISQLSTTEYVYYYEDYNYIIKKQERTGEVPFTDDEIENLKLNNDWGKDLNISKCIKQNITKNKEKMPCDEDLLEGKIIDYFELSKTHLRLEYFTSDTRDSFMIYGEIPIDDPNKKYELFVAYVKMKDGDISEISCFVPEDPYNYTEELINFKVENNWNNYND